MANIKTPIGTHAIQRVLEENDALTLAEISRIGNVSPQTVYRWSKGISNAQPDTISAIIEALGLNPADYGLEPTRKPKLTPAVQDSALQRDVQRVQRQLDMLIEYHRRGNDTTWILSQPNP